MFVLFFVRCDFFRLGKNSVSFCVSKNACSLVLVLAKCTTMYFRKVLICCVKKWRKKCKNSQEFGQERVGKTEKNITFEVTKFDSRHQGDQHLHRIYPCRNQHIPCQGTIQDDFPFPQVGYLSSLEGNTWFSSEASVKKHCASSTSDGYPSAQGRTMR